MYTIMVEVQRLVTEVWELGIEAEDPTEALDLAYEHMSEFPDSELEVKTRRRVEEVTKDCTVMDVEHKREEANDVGERVFSEEDKDAG